MAILTPWGAPVPLYNRENRGISAPWGPGGVQGPKYPDFLYCTVVEGSPGGASGGAPRDTPWDPSTTV